MARLKFKVKRAPKPEESTAPVETEIPGKVLGMDGWPIVLGKRARAYYPHIDKRDGSVFSKQGIVQKFVPHEKYGIVVHFQEIESFSFFCRPAKFVKTMKGKTQGEKRHDAIVEVDDSRRKPRKRR
jgi:hypothetical protein